MELTDRSARALAGMIARKEASSVEVVQAHLGRIESSARLNAVVTLDTERALAAATEADARLARGEAIGPLHGVPFTLKDMHATAGMRTTAGLVALADHVPTQDGVAAQRLKAAGAILLGKTNMAMNVESDGDLFGRPCNPYDEARTAGGSSGGAAAAVAARMIPLDIGTDMSGSIRMPAHYCGVFGLKPTESRVPQVGLVVLPRFDLPRIDRGLGVSGPLARTIDDLALALALLAGPHPADPSTPPVPVRPPRSRAASELRVALCPQIEGIVCSAEQRRRLERLGDDLRAAGATVVEGGLPFEFEELLAAYRRQMRAPLEVMAGHGAGPPGSEALLTSPLSVRDLYETWDVRDALIARFESFLEEFDTFMTPTTPDAAFVHRPRGEPIPVDGALVSSQVIDHPCLLATFTGCPALVVPIGLSESGLPIGAQLHARRWHDEALLDVGAAVAEVVGPLPAPP